MHGDILEDCLYFPVLTRKSTVLSHPHVWRTFEKLVCISLSINNNSNKISTMFVKFSKDYLYSRVDLSAYQNGAQRFALSISEFSSL